MVARQRIKVPRPRIAVPRLGVAVSGLSIAVPGLCNDGAAPESMSRSSKTLSPYLALKSGDREAKSRDIAMGFPERAPNRGSRNDDSRYIPPGNSLCPSC